MCPPWRVYAASTWTTEPVNQPSSECCLTGGVAGASLVGWSRASAYAPSQRHSHFCFGGPVRGAPRHRERHG
jgi:hypothetical protein